MNCHRFKPSSRQMKNAHLTKTGGWRKLRNEALTQFASIPTTWLVTWTDTKFARQREVTQFSATRWL